MEQAHGDCLQYNRKVELSHDCSCRYLLPFLACRFVKTSVKHAYLARSPVASKRQMRTGRRRILFTAMACLCVLLGGPSYAAGADNHFYCACHVLRAGRIGSWAGLGRCQSSGANRLCGRDYQRLQRLGDDARGVKLHGRYVWARCVHFHEWIGGMGHAAGTRLVSYGLGFRSCRYPAI